ICAITRTDVYQHWIHRNPESGTADRETKWIELEKRFTPGIDWTGFERYRRTPIYATPQIYHIPFGMVDYALARIVAMQIARIDHDDHERAMGMYIELCRLGGRHSFTDTLQLAGLRSPFDDAVIAEVAEYAWWIVNGENRV
ncbi:MAG: hypothetical protein H7X80_06510, partial [bacterium]|nr:hypothetical protein [Candidatus Kapabacteria bacterium]